MKKTFSMTLKTLGGLSLLLALFHGVENWRGKRAWGAWQREQEMKGEPKQFTALLPPPMPDKDNFAKVPCIAPVVQGNADAHASLLDGLPSFIDPKANGNWQVGKPENLDAWINALGKNTLAEGLAPYEARLDDIALAARRPGCRFPDDHFPQEVPSFLGFNRAIKLFKVRALGHLAAGRPQMALEDALTVLRIAQHLDAYPVLMTMLLQNAMYRQALQIVWEGLIGHAWQPEQLATLQQALSHADRLQPWHRMWQGERLFFSLNQSQSAWEEAQNASYAYFFAGSHYPISPYRVFTLWLLIPKGWHYQNAINKEKMYEKFMHAPINVDHHTVDASSEKHCLAYCNSHRTPYTSTANQVLTTLSGHLILMARLQAGLDQALIACALERYRIAKGADPETLDDLSKDFLKNVPPDLLTGKPLHYQKTGSDFQLYSVGWDGKDDGGTLATPADKPNTHNLKTGDWPWISHCSTDSKPNGVRGK